MSDFTLPAHVCKLWLVRVTDPAGQVLPPGGFEFYGCAMAPGGRAVAMVAEVRGDATELVLPGLCAPGAWDLSIFCREVATGVTWAVQQGRVNVTPAPVLAGVAPARDELVAVLDPVTHVLSVALGDSTASAAENARLAVAAREGADEAAARVAAAEARVGASEAVVLDVAAGAALDAERAEDSKHGAEAAAGDAAADAQVAEGKAAEAEESRVAAEAAQRQAEAKAAEAEAGAKVATEAVSDALAARDEAVAAQVVAEDASAQAGRYAEQAVGAADGAVVAQGAAEAAHAEAEAARVKAERSADEAEQNAALLGDAALRGADNVFSGVNSFVGGLLVENNLPLLWMLAGAYRFPLAAALAETEEEYMLRAPQAVKDEDWFMFAPRVPYFVHQSYLMGDKRNGRCFAVVPNLFNPVFAKEINIVAFAENQYCVINCYRCNVVSVFYAGKKPLIVVNYGHNNFSQAPNVFIDAPYMTGTAYGYVVYGLKTIGVLRVRMPRMQTSFTLKCGAVKREDLLYMLENMPDLRGVKKCTANLSCDPALEGDEDFLAAVAAFYDAETGTGWDVGLTFQQNERFNEEAAAAATYGLRRPRAVPVYAKRVPSEGGAWVDAAGSRWDLMTAHWVADESDWRLFDDEAAAVEEWGLTEMAMEETMDGNEISTEK